MRIVIFETMPEEESALRSQLPTGHEVIFRTERLCTDSVSLAANADIVSVFVKSEVSAAVIDATATLKLITTRSMGYDHIDVAHAMSKGIKVANVTTYASHPVAEFTFALLLAVTRRIYPAVHQMREDGDMNQKNLKGSNLFGKTLGVVGTGRIGKNVITIAKGFGMQVIACDAKPDNSAAAELGFSYVSLDELLKTSDVVSLHVPALPETHHMIGPKQFAHMKRGVIIINTARGEVIDTHALISALRDGTVTGAGLDVLEDEKELVEGADHSELVAANHVLIDMPNVVVTPHIAYETVEAMQEIDRATATTIGNFISKIDQPYIEK